MKHFNKNTKGRDFFVGDIHGMYDEFMNALAAVDFDFDNDRVFSVGDLIDRGPKSLASLGLILKPWFHAVMGNHEDMMIGGQSYHLWMMNGGAWSNELERDELEVFIELIKRLMPLFMTVDTDYGRVGVVHAESCLDWDRNCEIYREMHLWARHRIKYARKDVIDNIDLVVSGHTPVKEVQRYTNHVQIDTGAVFDDGYLTLMSVDELFN